MRIEVFEGTECFDELGPSWSDLLSRADNATPFQSPEWHQSWIRHYGRSKSPFIVAAFEGRDLVGVYPLARKRTLWSIIRSSGVGPGDYLHPLIQSEMRKQVELEFAQFLSSQTRASLLDLHQIREDQASLPVEGGISLDQATCLTLDLPKTFDEYLSMLGKSLRYDVRKLEKSMFKEGRATIEIVTEEGLETGFEILFDQHKKRWRKRGLPGAFIGKAQQFHLDWGRRAIKKGWLGLGILKIDGQAIGAIYSMSMGRSTFFYQAGFDPAHKSVSPGTLLVASMIRRSIEEGRSTFDFLRGDEPYKRRWKPQREHKNVRIIAATGGATGQFGARWNLLGSRIESKVRERLEGKGLL